MATIVSDVASVAQWTKYYNLWPCKGSTATHVTRIKDFSWKQTVACCGILGGPLALSRGMTISLGTEVLTGPNKLSEASEL